MKMQEVSFNDLNEFLDFLPNDERKIVDTLRKIIFTCAPEAAEKLSYNVPFYKQHRNFCFIWPASVLWGKTKTYSGVRLGLVTDTCSMMKFNTCKKVRENRCTGVTLHQQVKVIQTL